MSYEDLVAAVQEAISRKEPYYVRDDEILATFLRETDKVAIQIGLPAVELVTPIGVALSTDKTENTICHLSEEQYPKDMWSYKITMAPDVPNMDVCSKSMYFSDFCSMLKRGNCDISLVIRD